MAKINIKQFCKEFKAYEEKVGKTAADAKEIFKVSMERVVNNEG